MVNHVERLRQVYKYSHCDIALIYWSTEFIHQL